jgi:hypothetical protein
MRAVDACLAITFNSFGVLMARRVAHPCTTFEPRRVIWRSAGNTRVTGAAALRFRIRR